MSPLVFIFVPVAVKNREFESAVRTHLDSAEFIEVPTEKERGAMDDPQPLPLWKWFTF